LARQAGASGREPAIQLCYHTADLKGDLREMRIVAFVSALLAV